jgi:hypothetical protein
MNCVHFVSTGACEDYGASRDFVTGLDGGERSLSERRSVVEVADRGARERWLVEQRPALIHQDELVGPVEARVDEALRLEQRDAAGAAGQVHDRLRRGVL